jgi:hypothetical protein
MTIPNKQQYERMQDVLVGDLEISIRTLHGLQNCGARTLKDAYEALKSRKFHKQKGVGTKCVRELQDVIDNVMPMLKANRERELERVLELFLSWTGALAVTGSATPDAWRELVTIRAKAEETIRDK